MGKKQKGSKEVGINRLLPSMTYFLFCQGRYLLNPPQQDKVKVKMSMTYLGTKKINNSSLPPDRSIFFFF